MSKKLRSGFIYSAATILLLTGAAKIVSSFGTSAILFLPDPIFDLPFRYVFCVIGSLEIVVGLLCFLSYDWRIKNAFIVSLATSFVIYRAGLNLLGYHKPCGCLGSLTSVLHISPRTANTILKWVMLYLLIGSYGILIWQFKERRNARAT